MSDAPVDLRNMVAAAECALREGTDTRPIVELAEFLRQHPSKEVEAERILAELMRNRPRP